MRPRRSPSTDALRAAGLTLAGLALPAALLSCRTPPGPAPPIHADDASAPPPASAGGPRDAAPPFTVPPPSPPAGLLLGADFGAECVVERNVVRWWGTHITKQTANPLTITFPEDVTRVGCGNAHVCAVLASGSVQCAGEGNYGQLGIPTSTCAKRPGGCSDMPPAEVPGLPKIIDISVASDTTCVISEAGEVHCWGPGAWVWMTDADDHADAQPPPPRETHFRVPGLTGVRRIAVSDFSACALDAHGDVWCWGRNENGEMGRSTISKRTTRPERVTSLHWVSAITALGDGACALASGDLYCWGAAAFGDHVEARCKDDMPCTPQPQRMLVPTAAPIVALSGRCVLDAQGSAYCWGGKHRGGPGDAGSCGKDCVQPPRKLLGVPPLSQITDSGDHTCGLAAGREMVCWGDLLDRLRVTPTEKPKCADCEGPLFRAPL